MNKLLAVITGVLAVMLVCSLRQNDSMKEKYETALANVKSYDSMLSSERKQSSALQLTIGQLGQFQDSVLRELDDARKELKVKDSRLKALQKISSSFSRTDTVIVSDTIFREPSFSLDTLMRDEWYSLRLGLAYPSMIAVTPSFKSEKHVVIHTKKETVNPPKKCWLLRLFQKKHLILQVDVMERNPYVRDEESRYIEIVR